MKPIDQMSKTVSPFHDGERRVQERLGDFDVERWARGAIRDFMPDQHRNFFQDQPFMIVSARDERGRPWATVLEGPVGFVRSPDPTSLEILSKPVAGDALEGALSTGADIGLVGIELATRRRNRVNGRLVGADDDGLRFTVGQSFGNCPQYIRSRDYWWSDEKPSGTATRSTALSAAQQNWIRSADTFFIGSGYEGQGQNRSFGMDASHRGGERGFVEVVSASKIRFPDYAGNKFYNTLGNILLDGRAGFLFLDFSTGSLLQLTGKASIDFDSEDVARFPGARQLVSLAIEEIVELRGALRLRWQEDGSTARSLRLVEKTRESADVTSFVFEPRDGGPLPVHTAGQHLPIEIMIPQIDAKVQRTYSLSGPPNESRYRISVKREADGLVSRFLHDKLETGAMLEARKPAGDFVLQKGSGPIVLVSAGVGVTPVLSMLHQLVEENETREILFVHGARDGDHHPFRSEVCELVKGRANIRTQIVYSRPHAEDLLGRDYQEKGRVSADLLVGLVSNTEADYYLCGPAGFLAELKSGLEARGVREDKIHDETF